MIFRDEFEKGQNQGKQNIKQNTFEKYNCCLHAFASGRILIPATRYFDIKFEAPSPATKCWCKPKIGVRIMQLHSLSVLPISLAIQVVDKTIFVTARVSWCWHSHSFTQKTFICACYLFIRSKVGVALSLSQIESVNCLVFRRCKNSRRRECCVLVGFKPNWSSWTYARATKMQIWYVYKLLRQGFEKDRTVFETKIRKFEAGNNGRLWRTYSICEKG